MGLRLSSARSRLIAPLLGLVLLASQPGATWSIVCVNLRTREVGVGSATCLSGFNLLNAVPVIVVGEGAAAAQSVIDLGAINRKRMFNSFRDTDETPTQILARLTRMSRQYGIVNFSGAPVTFSGSGVNPAFSGVTGQVGDYVYAIQGNILVGDEVVLAAQAAFRGTKGDMTERIMAGMKAARELGGDGRCSCGPAATSCGVPPPGFTKSAHVGFMVVARMGDVDGPCNQDRGCAQGNYYLKMNVIGRPADPDPVFTLAARYSNWRESREGRPDAILSTVSVKGLPADGTSREEILIELRDIDGTPMTRGGSLIQVSTVDGFPALTEVGSVKDNGDGTYSIPLQAGDQAGSDRFLIRVIDVDPDDPDDIQAVTLWPPVEVAVVDASMRTTSSSVSASRGGALPLYSYMPRKAGASVRIVVSLGTDGFAPATGKRRALLQSSAFPVAPMLLDERGWAETVLEVPPGLPLSLVGRHLEVTGWVLDGRPLESTDTLRIEIHQ